MTTTSRPPPVADSAPTLSISIEGADVVEYAAVPTLRFPARIITSDARPMRSISLHAQIRIAATRRHYDAAGRRRLAELFGSPGDWSRSLRSLLWTHAAVQVPPFESEATVDVPVVCTYDFDVAATKYFYALFDGEVPLEFLFSGTMFYTSDGLLQAAQISWETEAEYSMPVAVWHDLMEQYFPNSPWLRLHRDTFDRLHDYKIRNTLATWDETVESLLRAGERDMGGERDGG